jgi:hypothetical protein
MMRGTPRTPAIQPDQVACVHAGKCLPAMRGRRTRLFEASQRDRTCANAGTFGPMSKRSDAVRRHVQERDEAGQRVRGWDTHRPITRTYARSTSLRQCGGESWPSSKRK